MTATRSANSVYPVVRLLASVGLMALGGLGMYGAIMVLEPVASEFGTGRGAASVPYTLFMVGFGLGGIVMGAFADRVGVMWPALLGGLCLPAGLYAAAQATALWQFGVAMGLLCGFFGSSVTFAPLVADVSHWFNARRGLAVGIAISGTYLAGALWPPILQALFDQHGWRDTFSMMSVVALVVMFPLALLLYPKAPTTGDDVARSTPASRVRPLGFSSGTLQCILCGAGVGCCGAMSMPQVHIVPLVTDLGFAAARGAEMLALMLGFGIVSRIASGALSDRIGGLRTLLVGSLAQGLVLVAFLFADTLTSLYAASVAFGLAQGGIVPSYAIIIRTFFASNQAGWRIGTVLLFTIAGMALGGWMAGVLYDITGSYTLSFINAIAFNVLNLALAFFLLRRARGDDWRSTGFARA